MTYDIRLPFSRKLQLRAARGSGMRPCHVMVPFFFRARWKKGTITWAQSGITATNLCEKQRSRQHEQLVGYGVRKRLVADEVLANCQTSKSRGACARGWNCLTDDNDIRLPFYLAALGEKRKLRAARRSGITATRNCEQNAVLLA